MKSQYPVLVLFLLLATAVLQSATAQYAGPTDPEDFKTFDLSKISGILDPARGSAVMISGELWDSFMPPNKGPYYEQAALDMLNSIRVGNFDRAWSSPTHMWPGGWDRGAFWNKQFEITVWDPDTTFNPPQVGGAANPAHDGDGNYAYAAYPNPGRTRTIPGKGDPTRDYSRETEWRDAQKRHHAVYEAGWPTNVGVDVKMNIHQYSLNWNNFNDFILVEFTLTNTGVVDINGDGTAEQTGHVIEGICLESRGEYMSCYSLNRAAGRGNSFGATRAVGYIADADASGAPWAMHISYPGESAAGARDMGLFDFPQRWYADVWAAWTWLGAKDASGNDFPTRFGTHAVGVGSQRGWFLSDGVSRGFRVQRDNSRHTFIGSMGTFFQNGGKTLNSAQFDLTGNANYFQPGSTTEDLRTFVPLASPSQPNGDFKTTNTLSVNTYEPGWTQGFTTANNFDGDGFMGVGPFKLNVGESVTVTWVTAGGFRLQGVANAVATARWVYENKTNAEYDLPFDYPAVPDMQVENTLAQSVKIRWDNRANTGPGFAGYKIYKARLVKRVDWLEGGMRGMDEYWRNMTVGPTPANLLKPINPSFGAQSFVAGRMGVPDSWGPYDLVAVIPAADLATYADNSVSGFHYAWEDQVVDLSFKYWYYVAAYTDAPITLANYVSFSNDDSTGFVETSNVNRNGASGLWRNTYPFADLNAFFPKTGPELKAIGTGFIVRSQLANASDIRAGATKIYVKPNPYKKKGLPDNAIDAFDHKVVFNNLPSPCTITILDVSGQVIDRLIKDDNINGSKDWDMFSKDGVEVASGLYIYVVEYEGGQHLGYFSILR
jgi:hypothetical protein